MNTLPPHEFQQRMSRIEVLIQAVEHSGDAPTRESARELMQAVLDLHAAGLARLVELLQRQEPGALDTCVRDDLVSSLLILHGLHPLDLGTRVRQALDRIQPTLAAQGARVELLAVAEGAVRARLERNSGGCPSSAASLRTMVEDAIVAAAPDATQLDIIDEEIRAGASGRLRSLPLIGV
jgi:Fe-S cluster biogenesis protein NfuA